MKALDSVHFFSGGGGSFNVSVAWDNQRMINFFFIFFFFSFFLLILLYLW